MTTLTTDHEKELREQIKIVLRSYDAAPNDVPTNMFGKEADELIDLFTRALQRQAVSELEGLRLWLFNRGSHQGCPDWKKVYNHIVERRDSLDKELHG